MIYLNGDFMHIEEAKISVLDRGFIFGDGVYEVIPVYSRRPFRLEEHLARLQASLNAIRLANPHSLVKWTELAGKIISGNPWDDQNVYLQITRGAAKRDHAFPKRSEEHTSELQSLTNLVCRLLLEKKKKKKIHNTTP